MSISFRIGSFRAEMLYWGVISEGWWRNYLHAHPFFFEVCYAFAGKGTFRINSEDFRVREGDLFVAKPRARHEIVSSRTDPLGVYFWAYTLTPTSTRMIAPVDNVLDALLSAFISGGEPVAHAGRHYERALLMLCEEIAASAPGHLQVVHALSLKLLLDTARAVVDVSNISEMSTPPMLNGASQTVQSVMRYLQDNYSKPTEVKDVAAQVHLSERHVSRLFRQATGTSILSYLTRLRMETACRLLVEGQLNIKQVARAVGYPDSHYFTTLFGRWMGVTPAVYRDSGGATVRSPAEQAQRAAAAAADADTPASALS